MKLKEYLEWKHQKTLKGGKKKNGSSKRKRTNHNNDSQGE